MTFQYTVREVTPSAITVDFDNGQWASFNITKGSSKAFLEDVIRSYHGEREGYDSVDDVPLKKGDSNTIMTQGEFNADQKTKRDAEEYTYATIRPFHYPSLGDQLDALYWSRKGDNTSLDAIDTKITSVKAEYPKTMTPTTKGAYEQAIADASG